MGRGRVWCALLAVSLLVAVGLDPARAYRPRPGLPEGNARIIDIRRFVGFDRPYKLMDLSRDGALVSFWGPGAGTRVRVGILDLTQDSSRFVATSRYTDAVVFSPDGRRLAIRDGALLKIVDLSTDVVTQVARVHPQAPVRWLDDGRLAYFSPQRALHFRQPGQPATRTGFKMPDPKGFDMLMRSVAVSPDGSRALYSRGCHTFLRMLGSATQREVGSREYVVPARAWSPDGSLFVLQRLEWQDCRRFFTPPALDILFTAAGRRVSHVLGDRAGLSHGHEVSWSNDGRWLLVTNQPTGTEVTGFQELFATDVRARTATRVVPRRVASTAFVGPGDWIVYSQFDSARGASHGHEEGAVKLGRLE